MTTANATEPKFNYDFLPEHVDVFRFATAANVKPNTVRSWAAEGYAPRPFRLGRNPRGRLIWHRDDVIGFLETRLLNKY